MEVNPPKMERGCTCGTWHHHPHAHPKREVGGGGGGEWGGMEETFLSQYWNGDSTCNLPHLIWQSHSLFSPPLHPPPPPAPFPNNLLLTVSGSRPGTFWCRSLCLGQTWERGGWGVWRGWSPQCSALLSASLHLHIHSGRTAARTWNMTHHEHSSSAPEYQIKLHNNNKEDV